MNCPVRQFCQCCDPSTLPNKKSAAKITRVDEFAVFSQDSHGRILLDKQEAGKRREGMWHLPRREHKDTLDLPLGLKTTYSITRYHVTLRIYITHADCIEISSNMQWHPLDALDKLPMPSPERKALMSLLA